VVVVPVFSAGLLMQYHKVAQNGSTKCNP
jgi:hypothetical protein